MPTRRTFLAAAAAVPALAQAPDAIRRLRSRKPDVKPITLEERLARIEKARRLMSESRIDALVLTSGSSLEYFTGVRWGLSERMFGAVIPASMSKPNRLILPQEAARSLFLQVTGRDLYERRVRT